VEVAVVVGLFEQMMKMMSYAVKRNYSAAHLVARAVLVKSDVVAVVEGDVKVVARHVVKIAVNLMMDSQLKNLYERQVDVVVVLKYINVFMAI